MVQITRRSVVAASTAAAALAGGAAAAPKGDHNVAVERFELTPSVRGIPRISYAVARGDMVYVSGVTASPGAKGDVADQTLQALTRIDELLAKAGTDKSKLLSATIWLTDMANFAAHNDAWNSWVDQANPPARACLASPQLWRPNLLVEVMVTAFR